MIFKVSSKLVILWILWTKEMMSALLSRTWSRKLLSLERRRSLHSRLTMHASLRTTSMRSSSFLSSSSRICFLYLSFSIRQCEYCVWASSRERNACSGARNLLGTWAPEPPPAAFVCEVLARGTSAVVPSHPLTQQSGPGCATIAPLKIMMMRVVQLQLLLHWWENVPECKWGDLTLM